MNYRPRHHLGHRHSLGLLSTCAGVLLTACSSDVTNSGGTAAGGNNQGGAAAAGAPEGGSPSAGAAQGGAAQGGAAQGGAPGGGAAQGGAAQGGAAQGGAPGGGAAQGGAAQGGAAQGGAGSGGGLPLDCIAGCEALFTCALELDAGAQLCPGANMNDGPAILPACFNVCESDPTLIALIDPNDCKATIQGVSDANPTFDNYCQNGLM